MSSSDDQKRERIFLDSSDPSMPNQLIQNSPSFIKLPFPPRIDPYKLVLDRKQGGIIDHIPARTPNAFILYRKIFIESAHKEGYYLPMTVISSMASKSWKLEPNKVKEEYKRISKQVFEIRNQLFPKSERKKKREKWNFVSFSKKLNLNDNSTELEMKISANQLHDNQLNGNSSNPSLEITNLFSSELSSNNINEDVSYIKGHLPNSNYQIHSQKSENYINLVHNSYISHDDNKNIEHKIDEAHNNTNVYVDTTSQSLNNNMYTTSTVDSDKVLDITSNYKFQPYY